MHGKLDSTAAIPAMVVIALVTVHDLVGPIEGADEVVAGTLGAIEGIYAGDAPPDLVVRVLIPCDVLVFPAFTRCTSLHTCWQFSRAHTWGHLCR